MIKRNFYLILGILGVGLMIYGIISGWTAWHGTRNNLTIAHGAFGNWQSIGALVAGATALPLFFFKPKMALYAGIASIVLAVLMLLMAPKQYIVHIGLYLSMGGAALVALGSLIAPKT